MTLSTLARCLLVLILAGAFPARDAFADAASAASTFFANVKRLGYETTLEASSTVDDRTLVDGLYRLEDKSSGELVGLITESGDILGDGTGWRWITKDGMQALSPQDAAQLRSEVLQNIQWNDLIKVQYGDGGGRRILLVSAVNCPFCARMEDSVARHAASIETTFYVLPMSLAPYLTSAADRASWRKAANIWCASDNAAAWRRFWATKQVADTEGCKRDEVATFKTSRNFSTVMSSIGVHLRGTPAMIREDGVVFSYPPEPDERYFSDVLGPKALGEINAPAKVAHLRWLAAPH